MDFFEAVEKRCSMRSFVDRPVDQHQIDKILQAANRAPSAGNLQAYEIYLVTDDRKKNELVSATLNQQFIAEAPVVLVFCTHAELTTWKYGDRGRDLYTLQDATIACTFAMLAATALGLASVWVGAFDDDRVWEAIGSPTGQAPVAVLPVGYPARELRVKRRRPIDEIVHRV